MFDSKEQTLVLSFRTDVAHDICTLMVKRGSVTLRLDNDMDIQRHEKVSIPLGDTQFMLARCTRVEPLPFNTANVDLEPIGIISRVVKT